MSSFSECDLLNKISRSERVSHAGSVCSKLTLVKWVELGGPIQIFGSPGQDHCTRSSQGLTNWKLWAASPLHTALHPFAYPFKAQFVLFCAPAYVAIHHSWHFCAPSKTLHFLLCTPHPQPSAPPGMPSYTLWNSSSTPPLYSSAWLCIPPNPICDPLHPLHAI